MTDKPSVCGASMVVGRWTTTDGASGNEFGRCLSPKPCPLHDKPNEVKHLVEVCECKCHTSGKGACLDCAQHDDDCTQKDKPCDGACTRGEFCSVHHTCFFKGFSCPKPQPQEAPHDGSQGWEEDEFWETIADSDEYELSWNELDHINALKSFIRTEIAKARVEELEWVHHQFCLVYGAPRESDRPLLVGRVLKVLTSVTDRLASIKKP